MSKAFTYKKLYSAYLDCRKNKRKTINALKFEWDLENNIEMLFRELKTKSYCPGRSICFVVTEPVPREIFAADFRDRIVHHLLIKEIIDYGERSFIYDSYACREGKGAHRAVDRVKKHIRQISKNGNVDGFYAQLDIKGFFMAIDKNILYNLVKKLVLKQHRTYQWQEDILWLAKIIIFHQTKLSYRTKGNLSLFDLIPAHKSLRSQPNGKGLPIGNYTSQFFANLYLNELDQFIKRELKCKYYVRYVDDFILLNKDKEKLKLLAENINAFLKNKLRLELNLNKTKILPLDKGIDFLGYFVKSRYTLVRKKVVGRFKNKMYLNKIKNSKNPENILAQINSYYGHFRHASSFNLRKNFYLNYLVEFEKFFIPMENFTSIGWNPDYKNKL